MRDQHPPRPSSPLPAAHRRKRSRYSDDHLSRAAEILKHLPALPLTPDLPPSPPASRSSSPAPAAKRARLDGPATTTAAAAPGPVASSSSHTLDTPLSSLAAAPAASLVPIRRPRRGQRPADEWDTMYNRHNDRARQFKFSGEARQRSMHPRGHREYKALALPPAPGSPYAQHGMLIARLEMLESLTEFVYAAWCSDQARLRSVPPPPAPPPRIGNMWETMMPYHQWVTNHWKFVDLDGDREKAFYGFLMMVEAYIHGRRLIDLAKSQLNPIARILDKSAKHLIKQATDKGPSGSANLTASAPTPPMLPSPATSSMSAGSTPNGTSTDRSATPSTAPSDPPKLAKFIPKEMFDDGRPPPAEADLIRIPLSCAQTHTLATGVGFIERAASAAAHAQMHLSLPALAKHFPTTFARVVHTTLGARDEGEPDIDDDDGELFWPGQLATGEGIGWVCLMGKAMIREFGRDYGYKGLDSVVPKPPAALSVAQALPVERR